MTAEEERRQTAVLKLRAERTELDKLHLATCTVGCRETRDEWPTDDEQAEADCLLVIKREMTAEEERRQTAVLKLRAERTELDKLHLATCTAGCRETRDEWPTDDEQAEADRLLVIRQEENIKLIKRMSNEQLFSRPTMRARWTLTVDSSCA